MASPRYTNQISPSGRLLRAGGITYNTARVLADILSPLVGQSERHVKNSSAFDDKIQDLEVPPGQKLISYDVTALFTSIPVPDAIESVQLKLSADDTLSERTSLSIDKILELLKFCLDTTYFVYKIQIYKQKRGAAMGSPKSPIIANLYMEVFEERALSTAPHPQPCGSGTWLTRSPISMNTA